MTWSVPSLLALGIPHAAPITALADLGDHTAAARLQDTYVARFAGRSCSPGRIVAELAQDRRPG
ncbi:MAG TPA: hypothetical protein VK887_06845, partial [Pseudonocardiaceae bacterium]|nr:hypothetical protein [Pseudonocardiaceae bacterium]